jgi:hypothetical protein
MKTTHTSNIPGTHSAEPQPLLRWILRRGNDALTCGVDARGDRSFDVCVVPHWDISASVIERFPAPTSALRRHAEIAARLRQSGWVVADHVPMTRDWAA